MPDTPEVLFVCVHNAGRSQMGRRLKSGQPTRTASQPRG
jgi:protein-tyrosine-phosphatase